MRLIILMALLFLVVGCSSTPTPTPPKGTWVPPSPTIPASNSLMEYHAVEGCTEYLTLQEASSRAYQTAKTEEEKNIVNRVYWDKMEAVYDEHLQYVVPFVRSELPEDADASYKEMQFRIERDQWFLQLETVCTSVMN